MLNKVLCIDDDPITLMICKKVIAKASFSNEIDTAINGEDAINYFDTLLLNEAAEYPYLIFLDLNMPIMGGWEFLDSFSTKIYRDNFPMAKVIVLSSTIDPIDFKKSKTYNMVFDFLPKPITFEMLESLKGRV